MNRFPFFAGLLILFGCTRYNPSITEEDLSRHVSFLASDSLKGRMPGTPGRFIAR